MATFKGYRLSSDFKPTGKKGTGNGLFAIGEKSGKKYFIKQNNNYVFKIEGFSHKDKDEANIRYKKFLAKRFRIQKAMKDAGIKPGDQVVIEEEIIEWENPDLPGRKTPVVITQLVTDKALKESEEFIVLSKLTWEQKKEIMFSMLTALGKIHSFGLIHADLKPDNFLVSRKGSKFTAYLIDFDESYFEDDIPDSVVQSPGYETPEAFSFHNEGIRDEDHGGISYITTKNDIYALGIIFHELLSGKPPRAILKGVVSKNFAHAHANKADLRLEPMLKTQMVAGKTLTYFDLILHMISFNPKTRPDCDQLLTMIQNGVTEKVEKTIDKPVEKRKETAVPIPPPDVAPFDHLFEDHHPWIELLPSDQMIALGVTSLKKAPGVTRKVYLISKDNGTTTNASFWQLVILGLAKKKKEPEIPDHEPFKNLSKDYLIRKNIVRIEHLKEDDYQVHYAERPTKSFKKEELVSHLDEGFKEKPTEIKTEKPKPPAPPLPGKIIQCEPYPEDNILFADESYFAENGVKKVQLNPRTNPKTYDLILTNDSIKRLTAIKMLMMGFAKKYGT